MTTPTQRGKAAKPSQLPGTDSRGKHDVTIEIKLQGSLSAIDADYATLTGASYTADAVTITMH